MANVYGPGKWKYGTAVLTFVDVHPCFSSNGKACDLIVFRDPYGGLLPMYRSVADNVVTPLDGMIPSQVVPQETEVNGHV